MSDPSFPLRREEKQDVRQLSSKGTYTPLPPILRWRPRVLFAYDPEQRDLHFMNLHGQQFRIKRAASSYAYACELLYEPIAINDLIAHMKGRYPEISDQAILQLLSLLHKKNLLEEPVTAYSSEIGAEDLQRYDRQLSYFGFFEQNAGDRYHMQKNLAQATITIIGVGGVGNWIARHLAAMGIGRLILVDNDMVELSNLNRQALYTYADIGQSKVHVAARVLSAFNPGIEIRPIPLKIASSQDVEQVSKEADIVVLTADKPVITIRHWTAQACTRLQKPYIQGSLDAFLLQVGPLYHVPFTGCYACRQAGKSDAEMQAYTARIEERMQSPRQKPPLTAPLCGFVGSAVAMDVVRYLTGFEPPATLGKYYLIDARTWTTKTHTVTRVEGCPICGHITSKESNDHETDQSSISSRIRGREE